MVRCGSEEDCLPIEVGIDVVEDVNGVLVYVGHSNEAELFKCSQRFVEDVAKNVGYVVSFAESELADTVEDVVVRASNAPKSYCLATIASNWFYFV